MKWLWHQQAFVLFRLKVPECFVECHHCRDGDQRQRAEAPPEWPTESWRDSGRWSSSSRWTRCHRENCHQVCCCQKYPSNDARTSNAHYMLIIMKCILRGATVGHQQPCSSYYLTMWQRAPSGIALYFVFVFCFWIRMNLSRRYLKLNLFRFVFFFVNEEDNLLSDI